jgi:hypothetical protein
LDGAIVEGNSIVVTASGGCCRVVGAHVRWSPESLIDRSSLARCEVEIDQVWRGARWRSVGMRPATARS